MADQTPPDEKHRKIATIHIGDQVIISPDPDAPNILHPVRECKVITVNGEIWSLVTSTFVASKELITRLWDVKDGHKNFQKLENGQSLLTGMIKPTV